MKKLLVAFTLLGLLTLAVACGSVSTSSKNGNSNTTGSAGGNMTVHLGGMSFMQSSITISKGSSVTLVDDSAAPHIIVSPRYVV